MDKSKCNQINKNVQNHISRIRGQILAIEKMINSGRETVETIQLISAIRASLNKLAIELLKEESQDCLKKKSSEEKLQSFEKIVTNLFKIN